MEMQFEYHSKPYKVEADADGSTLLVKIDDKIYKAKICRRDEHILQLHINDKNYQIVFAERGDERFLAVNGRNYVLKRLAEQKERRGAIHAHATQDLTAPMPGKIMRVFAKDGDVVEVGQALLILEAMKMEHTIKAHRAGVVTGLSLKEGDQVQLGQALLDIAE